MIFILDGDVWTIRLAIEASWVIVMHRIEPPTKCNCDACEILVIDGNGLHPDVLNRKTHDIPLGQLCALENCVDPRCPLSWGQPEPIHSKDVVLGESLGFTFHGVSPPRSIR
jgi:hypothetical protein